ncbi:MAG: iron dependent repressor, metal binding and dimerization domain protein [Opitutales bacterium]
MSETPLPSVTAHHHQRVRRQHQRELTQDYVEAIFSLAAQQEIVRVVDLQGVFGVSHVTVIRSLGRLEEQGLVRRPQRGQVELTQDGRALAEASYARHQLVTRFLRRLGVTESAAAADAEGIEHHLGKETLEAMRRFLEED